MRKLLYFAGLAPLLFLVVGGVQYDESRFSSAISGGSFTFSGTGPHELILDDGNGSGDTKLVGENNGDLSFYTDGTNNMWIDESASTLVMQGAHITYPGDRGIYSTNTALEIGGAHTPSAEDGTNDVSFNDSIEVNGATYLEGSVGNLAATCTVGEVGFDTAGVTLEICFCHATDIWACVAAATGGPAD